MEKQKLSNLYGKSINTNIKERKLQLKNALLFAINNKVDNTHLILNKEDIKILYNTLCKEEHYLNELIKSNKFIRDLKEKN